MEANPGGAKPNHVPVTGLSSRGILVMEQERQRLARELDGGLLQTLRALALRSDLCREQPRHNDSDNLEYVHAKIDPRLRAELVSLKTQEDRTLFFDLLQLELGRVGGLKPKFNLYTVPGQVIDAASRKLVLEGADGVVFVADSQADRLRDNIDLLGNLAIYLAKMVQALSDLPLVVQCNKQDLPNAMPPEELSSRLKQDSVPCL